jgi:hypothetical protein
MPKISSGYRFFSELMVTLGAVACILVWLGIKPTDVHMTPTLPHMAWLAAGLILFVLSLASSLYSIYGSSRRIAAISEQHKEDIRRIKLQNNSDLWRSDEIRKQLKDERKSALEEVSTLKDQLETLRGECDRKEKQFNAELLRVQEIGRIRDEERRDALRQLDEAKSQLAIFAYFDSLQLDAQTFSQEILQYIKGFEPKPPLGRPGDEEKRVQIIKRGEWLQRLMSGYELHFGQRGRDLTLRFRERGIGVIIGPEPRLFEDRVYQWANELVALAYKIDGITLHVGTLQ